MARPQVADRDGIQKQTVAANLPYKQSQTADKGPSSSLGSGEGTNSSSAQIISMLQNVNNDL
jgi:hypothetical protein